MEQDKWQEALQMSRGAGVVTCPHEAAMFLAIICAAIDTDILTEEQRNMLFKKVMITRAQAPNVLVDRFIGLTQSAGVGVACYDAFKFFEKQREQHGGKLFEFTGGGQSENPFGPNSAEVPQEDILSKLGYTEQK